MLAGVQVEHEVGQGPLQARAQVPIHRKARAGNFRGSLQVEHAKVFPNFPVRLGSKVELQGRTPAADFHVLVRGLADRDARVRNVGDADENLPQAGFVFFGGLSQLLDLLAQFLGFGNQRSRILPTLLQFCDLFRGAISLGLHGLRAGDGLAPLSIHLGEVFQNLSRLHAALAQLFLDQRQVVADKSQIKHGNQLL